MAVNLLGFGFAEIKPNTWNHIGVLTTYYRLYYPSNSNITVAIAGTSVDLEGGKLHFIPTNSEIDMVTSGSCYVAFAHFDIEPLALFFEDASLANMTNIPLNGELEALLHNVSQRYSGTDKTSQSDLHAYCIWQSIIYATVCACIDHATADRQHDQMLPLKAHTVAAALHHIEAHLAERLGNRDLGKLCNVSEFHFLRIFKECIGVTPNQYVLRRRVARAAQRLHFTDRTIERIADECGFGNRYYFTRVFTRLTGLSPAAYRRLNRV